MYPVPILITVAILYKTNNNIHPTTYFHLLSNKYSFLYSSTDATLYKTVQLHLCPSIYTILIFFPLLNNITIYNNILFFCMSIST